MRQLSTLNSAQLTATVHMPVFFVELTFNSGVIYTSTAPFPISWGGNTWLGVGDLGTIGDINETNDLTAQGTTLTLSAIDNTLLQDCLNDIGALLPANIYLGFMTAAMTLVDTPFLIFGGVVDTPTITTGPDKSSITLTLENRLLNLNRGNQRRYDAEDQHRYYPDDTAFGWVPSLNDLALRWG